MSFRVYVNFSPTDEVIAKKIIKDLEDRAFIETLLQWKDYPPLEVYSRLHFRVGYDEFEERQYLLEHCNFMVVIESRLASATTDVLAGLEEFVRLGRKHIIPVKLVRIEQFHEAINRRRPLMYEDYKTHDDFMRALLWALHRIFKDTRNPPPTPRLGPTIMQPPVMAETPPDLPPHTPSTTPPLPRGHKLRYEVAKSTIPALASKLNLSKHLRSILEPFLPEPDASTEDTVPMGSTLIEELPPSPEPVVVEQPQQSGPEFSQMPPRTPVRPTQQQIPPRPRPSTTDNPAWMAFGCGTVIMTMVCAAFLLYLVISHLFDNQPVTPTAEGHLPTITAQNFGDQTPPTAIAAIPTTVAPSLTSTFTPFPSITPSPTSSASPSSLPTETMLPSATASPSPTALPTEQPSAVPVITDTTGSEGDGSVTDGMNTGGPIVLPLVTNGEYAACMDANQEETACFQPQYPEMMMDDTAPVVSVTWHSAMDYCRRLNARLPFVNEWQTWVEIGVIQLQEGYREWLMPNDKVVDNWWNTPQTELLPAFATRTDTVESASLPGNLDAVDGRGMVFRCVPRD